MPTKYDDYRQKVLDKMWEESIPDPVDPDERIWEGGLYQLVKTTFQDVVVQPGKVAIGLQEAGCVSRVEHGGGPTRQAVYRLHSRTYDENNLRKDAFYHTPTDVTQQAIRDLARRVSALEMYSPMLREIAAERFGGPSPLEQIADALDEAAEGHYTDDLKELLPPEDPNSTQENT